jgi:hypothetical protein
MPSFWSFFHLLLLSLVPSASSSVASAATHLKKKQGTVRHSWRDALVEAPRAGGVHPPSATTLGRVADVCVGAGGGCWQAATYRHSASIGAAALFCLVVRGGSGMAVYIREPAFAWSSNLPPPHPESASQRIAAKIANRTSPALQTHHRLAAVDAL